jgi:LPXTG-motif cell wall-anchored protein
MSLSVVNPDHDQGGEHKGGDMQTPRFNRPGDGAQRSRTRLGVIVGIAIAALVPAVALAQNTGGPGGPIPPNPNGDYVTTTIPERSLDVSAFSPECIRDAPFVNYTIVPVGFTPDPPEATLVIKAKDGTVIDTREVSSLSGQFIWPGAAVDSAGNAIDWPGWKLADDGVSWIPDPSDAFLREGLTIEVTVNPTATATVSYPPATSACANPPDRALDVTAFSPVCIADAPFIEYAIKPLNFTSNGPAKLTFFDRNGNFVEERTVSTLSGRTIYPGASVDANGVPNDWPGWKIADDGVSWIPDPSDAFLREGLTITVEVNPEATAIVTYPPATSACANPPDETPPTTTVCVPGQNNDGNPNDDCTPVCVPGQNNDGNPNDDCAPVCVPGQNNDGNPDDDCTPCVPGQNNDGNPDDDCRLPRTGGGFGNALILGAGALLAGLLILTAARRRRQPGASPSAS